MPGDDERRDATGGEPTRRRLVNWFLGTACGALVASVVYPVVRFLNPPDVAEAATQQVDAGTVSDPELLETSFKIVPFGNEPVILIRAEGGYLAFAATCTHLDCTVEFRQDLQIIWCNCHNGQFDLAGQVIGGPPPRPLRRFEVHVVDDEAGGPASLVIERI